MGKTNGKVQGKIEIGGAEQAAAEVRHVAQATQKFATETRGMGRAAEKTNGAMKGLHRQVTETRTATDRARTAVENIKQSFALAAGTIALATRALALFVKGVQAARQDAKDDIVVRFNTSFGGETPEEHERRIARIRKVARSAMKSTGVSEDEIAGAASRRPEAFVAAGGAEQGALLGKITGIGTAGGMEWLQRQAENFGGANDPARLKGYVNTLLQASRYGNVDPTVLMSALERAGAGFAEKGGSFEDAALVAASMAKRKPARLGASMDAFFGTVGEADAKKRGQFKRAGFDFYDAKTGNIRSIDEISGQFAKFFAKNPSTEKQQAVLNDLFGGAGSSVAAAFRDLNVGEVRGGMSRSPGSSAFTKEMQGTLDFWLGQIGEHWNEGVADAFSPVEQAGAKAGPWAADKAEALRGWMGTDFGQAVSVGIPVGAGVALTAAGLWKIIGSIKDKGGIGKFLMGEAGDTANTAGGVAKGLVLSAMFDGKVQPVYVVNMPSGGMGGGGGSRGTTGGGSPAPTAASDDELWRKTGGLFGAPAAEVVKKVPKPIAGAAGAVVASAAAGAAVGYALNRATMEDAAKFDVKTKSSLADRLSGAGEETGLHQLNVFQVGMAKLGAFFGSDSMQRLLDERDTLNKGGNYWEAEKAARDAAAARQKEATDAQAKAAASLEKAGGDLAVIAADLRGITGTRGPGSLGNRGGVGP